MGRSRWIHPLDGLRALVRVQRDGGDTQAVLQLFEALDGPFFEGWFLRFGRTRIGRRILDEGRDLLVPLSDRAWLGELPEGSVGRAYLAFVEREHLSAEELVAASQAESAGTWGSSTDDARKRFLDRLRDQHDLEHVVTGYGRDELGETALLAFDLGQVTSLASALLVVLGLLELDAEGRRLVRGAYRRGRRAAWLPATDWETLLELPLSEVRAVLGVGDPPDYGQQRPTRQSAAA